MRKHEISKGVPKFVAMLAPNFKATLSYSIIANLCNFEYDFLIHIYNNQKNIHSRLHIQVKIEIVPHNSKCFSRSILLCW